MTFSFIFITSIQSFTSWGLGYAADMISQYYQKIPWGTVPHGPTTYVYDAFICNKKKTKMSSNNSLKLAGFQSFPIKDG